MTMMKELGDRVDAIDGASNDCIALHAMIIECHANAEYAEQREDLLALHEALMDKMDVHIAKRIGAENFKKVRLQEYNKLLLRECEVGGSFCVETLYELTQRELESGRMSPTHEFINLSINATASDHYTKDQLLRQKDKIQDTKNNSALNKISKLFKN